MIHDLTAVTPGFDISADAVVVGSGAGGSVAAKNLARAGLKTVVVEAGPRIRPDDMTRDAPRFLARNYWEGGLRLVAGTVPSPSMHARCLGGNTVVNSAIMFALPDWVKSAWTEKSGVGWFQGDEFDGAFRRVFSMTKTAPTPMSVLGHRNRVVQRALESAGIKGAPLPRAVHNCKGCGDCLTGCSGGAKQSVDRSVLPDAVSSGAEIFTCSEVERILMNGNRATGIEGHVVDPTGRRKLARFRVHAPRVIMAAGPAHTPVLLLKSGIHAKRTVGRSLHVHIGAGGVAFMDQVVDPWVGATQGWGAFSEDVPGMKYEAIWAPASLLLVHWGKLGMEYLERLPEVRHAAGLAAIYRGNVRGRVKARRDGSPNLKVWIPETDAQNVFRGFKIAVDALLKSGARYIATGIPGPLAEISTLAQSKELVSGKLKAKHLRLAMNHMFGSCPMSANPDEGPVDENGKVRGVTGVYACDASIFPNASAVNPQATVMAMSDILTRRLGELPTAADAQ